MDNRKSPEALCIYIAIVEIDFSRSWIVEVLV